jgi:hypothetical protein
VRTDEKNLPYIEQENLQLHLQVLKGVLFVEAPAKLGTFLA